MSLIINKTRVMGLWANMLLIMSRVYIGNLDARVSEQEFDDELRIYGVIRRIWVARKPSGYGFINFDDCGGDFPP